MFQRVRPTTRSSSTTAPVITAKSVAVLPFENLSDDKNVAYFADGIQDEILTLLSKIGDLKSCHAHDPALRECAGKPAQIAGQLGVAHILEGSVQKYGDAVRVNVQLIKAADDRIFGRDPPIVNYGHFFGRERGLQSDRRSAASAPYWPGTAGYRRQTDRPPGCL